MQIIMQNKIKLDCYKAVIAEVNRLHREVLPKLPSAAAQVFYEQALLGVVAFAHQQTEGELLRVRINKIKPPKINQQA